jgi:iron complex transport system permease protein
MDAPGVAGARASASTARKRLWFFTLAIAIVVLLLLSAAIGSVSIPLAEVVRILSGNGSAREGWAIIVLQLRLPRALTALAAGAALGVSGVQMQTLFRNPLADPFILGISSGASLGVGLLILAGGPIGFAPALHLAVFQSLGIVGAAAGGAFTMLAIMIAFASRIRSAVVLLVVGVMLGYFTSAMTSMLVYFASPTSVQRFHAWGLGSFRSVQWSQLPLFALCLGLGIGLAFLLTKQLNVLLLGENYAKSLGVNVQVVRICVLAGASILAGAVTAFCGPIAFLGIAAPHLARMVFGTSDHRITVPASMLFGAGLALACGIFAELPGTNLQLPMNVATSIVGAPIVVSVILRLARSRGDF